MQQDTHISDAAAAAAFRRLVAHLQHRHDAQNIDLMGLAGFCRNCLADWVMEADGQLTKDEARTLIHGIAAGGAPPEARSSSGSCAIATSDSAARGGGRGGVRRAGRIILMLAAVN